MSRPVEAPATALPRPSLWTVLLIALALRVAWGCLVPVQPVSDSNAYQTFARNLAAGQGYGWTAVKPSAYWPVGTSAVYALLYLVFGTGNASIVVLNILLGVATVALTDVLASRWFDPATGRRAALLLALWPAQIEFTTVLASELPFTFAILVALWCWSRPSWPAAGRAALAGLALAAASYIRPQALLLPLVLAGADLLAKRGWKTALMSAAVAGAVMLAAIAPWSLRNTRVFGTFVLLSTNGGANLWMGNHEGGSGKYTALPDWAEALPEPECDRKLAAEAKAYILAHPGRYAGSILRRLVGTYDRESIGVIWNPGLQSRFGSGAASAVKGLSCLYWWAVLALAVAGIALFVRRRGWRDCASSPPVAVWAYLALTQAAIVAQDRYHFPAVPFIAALAAVSLGAALDRARATTAPALPATEATAS